MQINFFAWIRDGVRKSVLMGVQDAVGQLETSGQEDLNGRLQTAIDQSPLLGQSVTDAKPRRRRLGRTLKDSAPES